MVQRYCQMTTNFRKAVIAVSESSSWKDASWSVNVADKVMIPDSRELII